MKKWTDILGYLLVLIGTVIFLFQFKVLLLYASDYLIFGSKEVVTITKINSQKSMFTYEAYFLKKDERYILTSIPTEKVLYVGNKIEVLISPHFKVFLLGKVVLISYIFAFLIFLLLSSASVISINRIFRIVGKKRLLHTE